MQAAAVSPDGLHLYTAGFLEDQIAIFDRDGGTGLLTFSGLADRGGAALNGPTALAVSPDGLHLYAAAKLGNALESFTRDAGTGQLTHFSTLVDSQALPGGGQLDGLLEPRALILSPDGLHLYAASAVDSAVTMFSRNALSGELTYLGQVRDATGNPPIDGLNGATALAFSPDGLHLYVAGELDDAIAVFRRDPATGLLTWLHRRREGLGGVTGLDRVTAVAVSRDGGYVFGASRDGNALTVFRRDTNPASPTFGRLLDFIEARVDGEPDPNGVGSPAARAGDRRPGRRPRARGLARAGRTPHLRRRQHRRRPRGLPQGSRRAGSAGSRFAHSERPCPESGRTTRSSRSASAAPTTRSAPASPATRCSSTRRRRPFPARRSTCSTIRATTRSGQPLPGRRHRPLRPRARLRRRRQLQRSGPPRALQDRHRQAGGSLGPAEHQPPGQRAEQSPRARARLDRGDRRRQRPRRLRADARRRARHRLFPPRRRHPRRGHDGRAHPLRRPLVGLPLRRDTAGNWGQAAVAGPYLIDTRPPRVATVGSVAATADGLITPAETAAASVTQILVGFVDGEVVEADLPTSYVLARSTVASPPVPNSCEAVLASATERVRRDRRRLRRRCADCRPAVGPQRRTHGAAGRTYRIFACSNEHIADTAANPLDGNGDGIGGDDFFLDFSVEAKTWIQNPNFDLDLFAWQSTPSGGFLHDAADAADAGTSGSARLLRSFTTPETVSLSQCVTLTPGGRIELGGRARIASATAGQPQVVATLETFTAASCQGVVTPVAGTPEIVGDTGGEWIRWPRTLATVPAGTVSARLRFAITGVSAPGVEVQIDDAVLRDPTIGILSDGFESGDLRVWRTPAL